MRTDKRKPSKCLPGPHSAPGLLGIGAAACVVAAGAACYGAGPAGAACSSLQVRDDAQILDSGAMQNAANACPSVPALAWTTNQNAGDQSAFNSDVQAMAGPAHPMVIGHNAQSNYTTVKIDPNAAGITPQQAAAAESYAATTFNSTYGGNQTNSTTAMLAAVRGLNSSLAADHGQSGMVAPAPGNNGNNGANGDNGANGAAPQNGANVSPAPMQPPSVPNGPTLQNPVPSAPAVPPVAPPTVTTPSTSTHHSGWRIFWWIAIPLIVLALLAALWRYLVGRNRHRAPVARTTPTYTRPTARPTAPPPPAGVRDTTPRRPAPPVTPARDVRPSPTSPLPPVREEVAPDVTRVAPATPGQPTIGGHGDDLVTYEVREPDGHREELHYVDSEGTGRTPGEWVDTHGVNERDVNQSWWHPGVKDTGER